MLNNSSYIFLKEETFQKNYFLCGHILRVNWELLRKVNCIRLFSLYLMIVFVNVFFCRTKAKGLFWLLPSPPRAILPAKNQKSSEIKGFFRFFLLWGIAFRFEKGLCGRCATPRLLYNMAVSYKIMIIRGLYLEMYIIWNRYTLFLA